MRIGRVQNRAFTPRDWLPVAAAIAADANERVAGGIKERITAPVQAEVDERIRRAHAAAVADSTKIGEYSAARDSRQESLRSARMRADAAAGRVRDLAVHVGPGATMGTGAPAFYREADREIVLDSAVALPGVDPASVRWDDPLWRAEHLRAAGLVEHEVGHAAHTPRRVLGEWHRVGGETEAFARRLEETRMEASALRSGADRAALAGVAHELILREFEGVSGDRFRDAMDAALILGRSEVHGGSLPDTDLDPFRDAYEKAHGAGFVETVERLVGEWNSTEDDDVPDGDGMRDLLGRWRSGIGLADDEDAGADPDASGMPDDDAEASDSDATGKGSSGEGEGSGTSGDPAEDDSEAGDGDGAGDQADEDDDEGSGGGDDEADDDDADAIRDMLEQAAGEAGTKAAQAAAEMREAEAEADRAETDRVTHGYTPSHGRFQAQRVEDVTATDRRFAVELSRELRRIALPEVMRSHKSALLPPGRLRGRAAVMGAAQRRVGMVPTAEPWRASQKSITKSPPPVVGIMVDVSGSMSVAQRPAAVAAWALAEAGRSVQARTAMVTFGDRGKLVDHQPTRLTVTHCGGGWENFREGFALLDRKLRLTTPATGARLLVVVSDGALVGPGEGEAAARIMRRLEAQGVVCLWVPVGTAWAGNWGEGWPTRAGLVVEVPDPARAAEAIAAGVEAAMRRVKVAVR